MKSDKEILGVLRRFKEAKVELKKYLNWIEQIKLETVLSAQSEKQVNYFRMPEYNKVKGTSYPTNESSTDVPQIKCNQMTFQSQQLDPEDVRNFINKYEKMLFPSQDQQASNNSQKLLITRDSKQQFGTNTIEEMFKLSSSQLDSEQQNSSAGYDTSNFGHDQLKRKGENEFNNLMNYSKECEQSVESSKCFKEQFLSKSKIKIEENQCKQQKKSFEQFYQEHVEEEINNIQNEIDDIQRFLQRVQTAKDKLTNSFKDLQQIPVLNKQASDVSISRVTEDLKVIESIKNNMMKFLETEIDSDKLKKLKNMKLQIQLCFNNVEDELLKINEGTSQF